MKTFNFKKIAAISALSLVAVVGSTSVANAQVSKEAYKQQQKAQERLAKQRERIEKQNLRGNNRSNGVGYYNGNANANRYRVYRSGRYYNTDSRGAELLRQAVNAGYQQGFQEGRNDRSSRRRSSWNNSNIYRTGTYGYQSYVDRSQYQYYFQQGFQRGYQDGYNSRYQYGTNNGGGVNILGSILSSILNIQSY